MKRIFFFLIALISAFAANAQTGQPEFSTTASPKWYTVEFKTGGHYLKDPGSGRQLVTATETEEAAQHAHALHSHHSRVVGLFLDGYAHRVLGQQFLDEFRPFDEAGRAGIEVVFIAHVVDLL